MRKRLFFVRPQGGFLVIFPALTGGKRLGPTQVTIKKFLVLFVCFLPCAIVQALLLSRTIYKRTVSDAADLSPAPPGRGKTRGRIVFGAYNLYALDIQRKQTLRVKKILWSKTINCVSISSREINKENYKRKDFVICLLNLFFV